MLEETELADVRADADELLPDSGAVLRKVVASDGGGGQTEAWAPHSVTSCRIAPLAGGERAGAGSRATVGDKPVDETTHVVTLPAKFDVRTTDRIVVGEQTYEVTLVRRRGTWELTRRVEVKEVPA